MFLDVEFDRKIEEYSLDLFSSFEERLKSLHLVKDDYDSSENLFKEANSLAERFFISHKADIKQFLIREMNYERNGTGVWITEPKISHIKKYFEYLIEQY